MALKDSWVDKKDGDYILAEDINSVAHGVIDIEENLPKTIDEKLGEAKEGGEFDGKDGLSAYELALKNGTTTAKSEAEWLASLKGTDGRDGVDGADGKDGVSPVVEVFKSGKVASIQVTDVNGTMTTNIKDGEDGVSPTVSVSKDGKVTTILITDANGTKTVTLNDGADGESGGDWSVNDENVSGYIKNRTHYKEVKGTNVAVLPQTSVDFDTGAYLVHGFAENSFIEGNKYIVVWNGKEYEAHCYVEDGTYVIGNGVLADMTTKTDHPFCVVSFGGSACYVYKETDTAETITIKINGVQETIYHQLDPQYVKDMYYTEERNDVEILPTSTAIDTGNAIMGELYVVGDPITLVEGKTYKVTYNGLTYESVASAITIPSIGAAIGLGDVGLLATGSPTGAYPFVLAANDAIASEGASVAIIPLDGSTSVTVSIVGYAEIIHGVPDKFLPKTPIVDFSKYGYLLENDKRNYLFTNAELEAELTTKAASSDVLEVIIEDQFHFSGICLKFLFRKCVAFSWDNKPAVAYTTFFDSFKYQIRCVEGSGEVEMSVYSI